MYEINAIGSLHKDQEMCTTLNNKYTDIYANSLNSNPRCQKYIIMIDSVNPKELSKIRSRKFHCNMQMFPLTCNMRKQ